MHISRFALLVLINLPIVLVGIIGAITSYKTSKTSKEHCYIEVVVWLIVGTGLVFVEPVYNVLLKNHLTNSAPMSIFDIVLLTLVLLCAIFIKSANEKISALNKKLSRIHEHIVINGNKNDAEIK